MNEHDSEVMKGLLTDDGYSLIEDPADADVILINTCCIRDTAQERVYGRIGQLKGLMNPDKDVILGICGCVAENDAKSLTDRFSHISLVLGTRRVPNLISHLHRIEEGLGPIVDTGDLESRIPLDVSPVTPKREGISAWVSVMSGCDYFCSYCIVPYVRGRIRSRKSEEIVDEVKRLGKKGYREITLLGQSVNSYGLEREGEIDFGALMLKIIDETDIPWIRFTTSHPADVDDNFIDVFSSQERITPYFHLPFQAGSNRILKKMNRRYTREAYIEIIEKIRMKQPETAFSTDIIVGFPGETEEDFAQTMDLVESVRFDSAYMFAFSPRKGTRADTFDDKIPEEEQKRRLYHLIDTQKRIAAEKNLLLIGKEVTAMVEGPSPKNSEVLTARTETNKIILFQGEKAVGSFCKVYVDDAKSYTLYGTEVAGTP